MVFNSREGLIDMPIELPCGLCIGCRLDRCRQWAFRCIAEASLHDRNAFVTLTYDDWCLPNDGSLNHDHFQKFIKRLRKRYGAGIKYFMAGEYGDLTGRPHYHACIFGYWPPDAVQHTVGSSGHLLYTSESLQAIWSYGNVYIGHVTMDSAAYVAQYVTKKVLGSSDQAKQLYVERYMEFDPLTGELLGEIKSEYCQMSRRPGIGADFYKLYNKEVHDNDSVILPDGREIRPPRYFDRLLEKTNPALFKQIKSQRISKLLKSPIDPDRLECAEIIAQQKHNQKQQNRKL